MAGETRHANGAVAAGDHHTAQAAADVLADGGNAFDAALAGLFAASVVEPVLCSLGGGGFLLAQPADRDAVLYDFFCQTPRRLLPENELEFRPAPVDFGAASQEFHIGMGAVAVPGLVAGAFAINNELCRLPMTRLMAPAVDMARNGLPLAPLQSFILEAVAPIFQWSESSRAVFDSPAAPGKTLRPGDVLALPALADLLEGLCREGPDLFYRGEVAAAIAAANEQGGALDKTDLAAYRVVRRPPLLRQFAGSEVLGNPAPSSGGPLLAFTLGLLDGHTPAGSGETMETLAQAMALTSQARRTSGLFEGSDDATVAVLLSEDFMQDYKTDLAGRASKIGGTTHISVVDNHGNAAALSVSNGERCGHMLPGYDFMLNNMLGEEDLNPNGFFQWRPNSRITSMMSPTLVRGRNGAITAMGSGGSNRIRSAILQVLVNVLGLGLSLQDAVDAPRIHLENGFLNIEDGHQSDTVSHLCTAFPEHKIWPDRNFFFGGVHAAAYDPSGEAFSAAGDPRRGGSTA